MKIKTIAYITHTQIHSQISKMKKMLCYHTDMEELEQKNLSMNVDGAGDNVMMLIHPYPVNNTYFSKLHDYLPDGWKAIFPDLPGFGDTPEDRGRDSLTMSHLAYLIKEHLPDNYNKLVLGGVSMGGYITMAFVKQYPDLADAYILANTRDQADADGGKGRQEVVTKIQQGNRDEYIEELLPKLLAESNLDDKELVQETKAMIASTTDRGLIQTSLGMGQRRSSREILKNVEVPILLITGDEDSITGIETMSEMNEAYQHSLLHVVDNAGHYAFYESPTQSSKIIREFLDSL